MIISITDDINIIYNDCLIGLATIQMTVENVIKHLLFINNIGSKNLQSIEHSVHSESAYRTFYELET